VNHEPRSRSPRTAYSRPIYYCGPAHLGSRYVPFNVNDDPNSAEFAVANLALGKGLSSEVLENRQALLRSLDAIPRALEEVDQVQAIDVFQRQALELLTGERARAAFAVDREPATLRDRYGRNDFGQRMLLARRLVEAGVPFVAVRISPGQKGADWDDHQALPTNMKRRAPIYDRAMAALITDLRERGMNRDVLVVGMGEFGRTPRMNAAAGRDHWPAVSSVVLAGGRYRMGQVIGATDAIGGEVASAPYAPQSVSAMVYRHLGIDPSLTFFDHTGRPRYLLEEREPIVELL